MPRITRDLIISDTVQALRRVFKAIQDYSQDVSDRFGITGPQLWALKTIFQADGLSHTELSKKMYLHPSTVSGVVDRLEKKGYLTRDRDKGDRRVIKVRLTTEGKTLVKSAPNPTQGKLIHGLRKLKKPEIEAVHASVQKLVEIVEAQNVKATFFFDQESIP